jgi:hypothetical protein
MRPHTYLVVFVEKSSVSRYSPPTAFTSSSADAIFQLPNWIPRHNNIRWTYLMNFPMCTSNIAIFERLRR